MVVAALVARDLTDCLNMVVSVPFFLRSRVISSTSGLKRVIHSVLNVDDAKYSR